MFVHRLVAECFLPPPAPDLTDVHHIDNDCRNNAAYNLEYVTHEKNLFWMQVNQREIKREAMNVIELTPEPF